MNRRGFNRPDLWEYERQHQICDEYESGKSVESLSKTYKTSPRTLTNILERNGIKRRTGGRPECKGKWDWRGLNNSRDHTFPVCLERSLEDVPFYDDTVSLDAYLDKDGLRVGDTLENIRFPSPEDVTVQNILREHICNLCEELKPIEEIVIMLRFGIGEEREFTLQAVGEALGVHRERVRQIEARGLRRLRYPERADVLREFLPEY